jgi:hypothetical protein|tara:strand:- start:190 stop:417 length:228 start_codon:yes stop_codon:yes gene_type:complete
VEQKQKLNNLKQRLPKLLLGGFAGAIIGYIYYYYIGCNSGHCAITGNPINSTAYGAFAGFLWMYPLKKKNGDTNL